MQNIVIDKPYVFIGPKFNRFWLWVVRKITPKQLKNDFGVITHECRGVEKLKASLAAEHGVMLDRNYCLPCDPLVMNYLAQAVDRLIHAIASQPSFPFRGPAVQCILRAGGNSKFLAASLKMGA